MIWLYMQMCKIKQNYPSKAAVELVKVYVCLRGLFSLSGLAGWVLMCALYICPLPPVHLNLTTSKHTFSHCPKQILRLKGGWVGVGMCVCVGGHFCFLATLVALHFTPVSKWVSEQSFGLA